ncbi:hypothetical protein K8Q98_03085 [Candidatus Nomurabacteria bacterium]|nr:hypothetical protein [Candidatus Nomurabacteria bacterium]
MYKGRVRNSEQEGVNMSARFVVAMNEQGRDNSTTRRVLNRLDGLVTDEEIKVHIDGSDEAEDLWMKAVGNYGRRKQTGVVLVVVVKEGVVLWACCEPTSKQLGQAYQKFVKKTVAPPNNDAPALTTSATV